jgi:hypothetical protein
VVKSRWDGVLVIFPSSIAAELAAAIFRQDFCITDFEAKAGLTTGAVEEVIESAG